VPEDLEFPMTSVDGPPPATACAANMLTLTARGTRLLVEFRDKSVPDESQVMDYRQHVLEIARQTGCREMTFDLIGINLVPSRMLGLFVELRKNGYDIELVNVSPFVQDIFRVSKLDSLVTIREGRP
jgi:anti-anti-sigma factor